MVGNPWMGLFDLWIETYPSKARIVTNTDNYLSLGRNNWLVVEWEKRSFVVDAHFLENGEFPTTRNFVKTM